MDLYLQNDAPLLPTGVCAEGIKEGNGETISSVPVEAQKAAASAAQQGLLLECVYDPAADAGPRAPSKQASPEREPMTKAQKRVARVQHAPAACAPVVPFAAPPAPAAQAPAQAMTKAQKWAARAAAASTPASSEPAPSSAPAPSAQEEGKPAHASAPAQAMTKAQKWAARAATSASAATSPVPTPPEAASLSAPAQSAPSPGDKVKGLGSLTVTHGCSHK